jgi:hypothetical protein
MPSDEEIFEKTKDPGFDPGVDHGFDEEMFEKTKDPGFDPGFDPHNL